MKITDMIGNEISTGDLLVVKPDHVIAQVVSVETGLLARPQGQQVQPHLIWKIEMSGVSVLLPSGQVPGVIKAQKPGTE